MVVKLLSMDESFTSRISSKYLNLCSKYERRPYRCGTTWGWVINNRIFFFGWTNPLTILHFGEFILICMFSYDLLTQWWLCLGVDLHAYFLSKNDTFSYKIATSKKVTVLLYSCYFTVYNFLVIHNIHIFLISFNSHPKY